MCHPRNALDVTRQFKEKWLAKILLNGLPDRASTGSPLLAARLSAPHEDEPWLAGLGCWGAEAATMPAARTRRTFA